MLDKYNLSLKKRPLVPQQNSANDILDPNTIKMVVVLETKHSSLARSGSQLKTLHAR